MKKIRLTAALFSILIFLCGCTDNNNFHDTKDTNEYLHENTAGIIHENMPELAKEIRDKYKVKECKEVAPFYNVSQDTSFVFHFSSNVPPAEAVTVHTDSKCNIDSMVYQVSEGWKTKDGGTDVIVSPGIPVLNGGDRHTEMQYAWGFAPSYYLCIRYDFDTAETVRLDEPIVVPFTIDSGSATPNVHSSIGQDGRFQISWDEIDDAVSYNIYEAENPLNDTQAWNMKRRECSYEGDKPKLIASTKDCYFDDFGLDGNGNISDTNGYTSGENVKSPKTYYVTSVTEDGKESGYSRAAEGRLFWDRLPKSFEDYSVFEKEDDIATVLPETLPVKMADGSTSRFSAYYSLIEEKGEFAIYQYSIAGTMLDGEIKYKNQDNIYDNEVIPFDTINTAMEEIDSKVMPFPDSTYNHDRGSKYAYALTDKTYEPTNDSIKISYDKSLYEKRAKMEEQRANNFGVYDETANPVGVFLGSDKRVKWQDIKLNTVNKKLKDFNYAAFADSAEEEYLAISMIHAETKIPVSCFPKLLDVEYLLDVLNKVIYQNPYVIGIKSFSYDTNKLELSIDYYKSPGEIQKQQDEIKSKSDQILKEIIKDGMSEEEKVKAIWDYLEQNAEYDDKACESAEKAGFRDISENDDAFSVYGVICNGKGVCQSYMYAMKLLCNKAGVECMSLTGYVQNAVPHGWNMVKLNGKWYWIDTTNNNTNAGVPYFIYQTSEEFARKSWNYVLNEKYALDTDLGIAYTDDMDMDYYVTRGLYADNQSDIIDIVKKNLNSSKKLISIKCSFVPDINDEVFIENLSNMFLQSGYEERELSEITFGNTGQMFTIYIPD